MASPKKHPKKDDAAVHESNHSTPPKSNPPKPAKPPTKPASQPPRTVIEPLEDRQHL